MASMRTACASWSMRKMYLAVDFFLQRRYRFDSSLRVNRIHRLVTSLVGKYEIAARPILSSQLQSGRESFGATQPLGFTIIECKNIQGRNHWSSQIAEASCHKEHSLSKRCQIHDAKFMALLCSKVAFGHFLQHTWVNSSISIHRTVRAINFFRSSKSLSSHFLL
jgi:hypothetical protein